MRRRAFWLEWVLPPVALLAVGVAVRVLLECGFVMGDDMAVVAISDVQSGGIRWIREQVNLQELDGEAKPYQVRQVMKLVERYNLRLEDET